MTQGDVMGVFQEAMLVAFKLAGPILLLSIAATQIHEQTLTFVPKVLAIALVLLVSGSWMITLLDDLVKKLFNLMAGL